MRTRYTVLLVIAVCMLLTAACFGSGEDAEPEMAANLGLARKGLSPSEVDLPCQQAESDGPLSVVSCRVFRHLGPGVHLVGEIENNGDVAVGNVTIEATGATAQGEIIDQQTDTAYLEPVLPGEKTPFRVFIDAGDVTDVQLIVSSDPSDADPFTSFEVSNVAISEPSSGYSHITGEVTNPGDDPVDALFIAILRDGSGQAVEVHREKLIKQLAPGSNNFDVLALFREAATVDIYILPR